MEQDILENLYLVKKYSVADIAAKFKCSQNKINHWLLKYSVPKRTISDALYFKHNPKGDPFTLTKPKTVKEGILYGLGIGLYWGEGNKKNKSSVRLGNVDPILIHYFIKFLKVFYGIKYKKLKFGLQIFSDTSPVKSRKFWARRLGVSESQFQKVTVTPSRGLGTYKYKSPYGVLTVYYNNKKLRDIICGAIENIQTI